MRLDDTFLVKDNHLRLCDSVAGAVRSARAAQPELELIVEADRLEQALEAAQAKLNSTLVDKIAEAAESSVSKEDLHVALERVRPSLSASV